MTAPDTIACRAPWAPVGPERPAKGRVGLWGVPGLVLHRLDLPDWPVADLRLAVVAEPHVCRPWVAPERRREIVAMVNGLGADLILLAGDVLADPYMPALSLPAEKIAPLLAPLTAPLGVFAVMGNHDWKDCRRARRSAYRESSVVDAFAAAGIALVRNGAVRLSDRGGAVWLVMTDSQRPTGKRGPSFHDRDTAFAAVPRGAPAILLAHEPDCFADGDPRARVQISGHTHGGQFVAFGRRPMTPSVHGDRYAIGHHTDGDRHLVVSAGIGYSGLPFRLGVPPEITLIELRPRPPAATAQAGRADWAGAVQLLLTRLW